MEGRSDQERRLSTTGQGSPSKFAATSLIWDQCKNKQERHHHTEEDLRAKQSGKHH